MDLPTNKINQLKSAGIESMEQLACFRPRKYEDFRRPVAVKDLADYEGLTCAVVGNVVSIRDGVGYINVEIQDGDAKAVITWFNQPYLFSRFKYKIGTKFIFYGKVSYNLKLNLPGILSPVFYSDNPVDFGRILPIYKKVKGMSSEYLSSCINSAVGILLADKGMMNDNLPQEALSACKAPGLVNYLIKLHNPTTAQDLDDVKNRWLAEDLYPFCEKMVRRRLNTSAKSQFIATKFEKTETLIRQLPFKLTRDQDEAVKGMIQEAKVGTRIDALVQGDVGSGKTVVALIMAVLMAENGYQVVLMAPTTVLAEQHFNEFQKYLSGLDINAACIINGMKKRERKKVLEEIADGSVKIIIGTHSVFSEDVVYNSLSMVIVDEEHRFGVEQREKLREKTSSGVHSISMTATPIPRTLAIALYGTNTKVWNIRTMPSGRKPVITVANGSYDKVFAGLAREVERGHQCFIVCPLVEDSEKDSLSGVFSVETIYRNIKAWMKENGHGEIAIDHATGEMKAETINSKLAAFAEGKTKIMVSTTIIEVGVNVPNATVMVISNAERFGLAQLHQLRGRVGRGNKQGFCVLMTAKKTSRIETMLKTTDGFLISQEDFRLRGSGDVVGTRQHGYDRCVDLMLQYPDLFNKFCAVAEDKIKRE